MDSTIGLSSVFIRPLWKRDGHHHQSGEDDLCVSLFKWKESCAMSSASISHPGIPASNGKTGSKPLEIGQDAGVAGR